MRSTSPLWARNSRKAAAVVAKPPGTRMPAPASWLIISPSEAFLPPTRLDVGHAQAIEGDDAGGFGQADLQGQPDRAVRAGDARAAATNGEF